MHIAAKIWQTFPLIPITWTADHLVGMRHVSCIIDDISLSGVYMDPRFALNVNWWLILFDVCFCVSQLTILRLTVMLTGHIWGSLPFWPYIMYMTCEMYKPAYIISVYATTDLALRRLL